MAVREPASTAARGEPPATESTRHVALCARLTAIESVPYSTDSLQRRGYPLAAAYPETRRIAGGFVMFGT